MRRSLAALLLVAVALAPAVSRAHLRFSTHPTPAQDNARFKWSNSCDCVTSRPAEAAQLAPIPAIYSGFAANSLEAGTLLAETNSLPLSGIPVAPSALRAPPL